MKSIYIIWLIIAIAFSSCRGDAGKPMVGKKPGKNELADINKYFVQKDRELIQNFIERKKLTMKESSTGLWYFIKEEGEGKYINDNDKVSIQYVCSLLDGTECYNSHKTGPKEYILGKSEIESGLYEGLRLLKPGGEAVFILPPFLAWGLVGDGKAIPSRAVLVYEIKVLK
jgi:FKBP-type peptidyl-prolyl cis-trans isomerase FkpA